MLPERYQMQESWLEKYIFSHRLLVCLLFLFATVFFSWQLVSGLKIDARFEKMLPYKHPFIQNMLEYVEGGGANTIRIAVVNSEGDIFNRQYMEILRQVSDEVFYFPGVDRAHLKSLWSSSVRWLQVTEEGFSGGPVIPDNFDGSVVSLAKLKTNILRSGEIGRIVANDFQSSIILVPLFETDPETGGNLDYQSLSEQLEQLRKKYQGQGVDIHIIGLAKIFGDLFAAVDSIIQFFLIAIVLTGLLLFLYSRCWRSSILPLFVSLVAVLWQMGLLAVLGYSLDLYSILVPFLVFAIGVSHGLQVVNSVRVAGRKGVDSYNAARLSFRALYRPGMLALVSDAIGFCTLLVIDIPAIGQLAITASIGVAVIILTNLVLLPVLLSYIGVRIPKHKKSSPVWMKVSALASPSIAKFSIIAALVILVVGVNFAAEVEVGDLDPGAPEFHPDSRYNRDNQYITSHYGTTADVFVVYGVTQAENCSSYRVMDTIDRYMWHMENIQGVQGTLSLVTVSKKVIRGLNEGNLKWATLSPNPYILNNSIATAGAFHNADCSVVPVQVYLNDHKAQTLKLVVDATREFARQNNNEEIQLVMASGNAGVEAATNEVISSAQIQMLFWVYSVVSLLCFLAFRSVRAVLCIIIPLGLTSVLCQALMTVMGIGIKVATLPVIALGVGIGVDYGIYIFSRLDHFLRQGFSIEQAYYQTLRMSGRAVIFTGVSLAVSVGAWIFSPLKFQADMGMLLIFMFVWNMIGAIWLLPALARFLLKTDRKSRRE